MGEADVPLSTTDRPPASVLLAVVSLFVADGTAGNLNTKDTLSLLQIQIHVYALSNVSFVLGSSRAHATSVILLYRTLYSNLARSLQRRTEDEDTDVGCAGAVERGGIQRGRKAPPMIWTRRMSQERRRAGWGKVLGSWKPV